MNAEFQTDEALRQVGAPSRSTTQQTTDVTELFMRSTGDRAARVGQGYTRLGVQPSTDGRGGVLLDREVATLHPESGSDGWCTPAWLAEKLGMFDLDPCSNQRSHIHAYVTAGRDGWHQFSDGLALDWRRGTVFCNPPYSNVMPWAQKLATHRGDWCALVKFDPTTRWWAKLMEASPWVAPFRKRIKFENGRGDEHSATFPSALVYVGWQPSADLLEHLWSPGVWAEIPPPPTWSRYFE